MMAEDDVDAREPDLRGRQGPFYLPNGEGPWKGHRLPQQPTFRVCQVKTCRRHTHHWRLLPGPLGLVACESCWHCIQDMKAAVLKALRRKREALNAQS